MQWFKIFQQMIKNILKVTSPFILGMHWQWLKIWFCASSPRAIKCTEEIEASAKYELNAKYYLKH